MSIAAPWNGQPQWWLQLLSLATLAGLVQQAGGFRRAALLGWAFAIAWLAGTFWWLFISMHVYGGLPAPLAVVAVLALAAFLGGYYAAACAAFAALRGGGFVFRAVLFASLWLFAELARITWFTGFPWGAGGYAHVDGPLSALAPQVGVHGIGFAAALLAFALSLVAQRGIARSWRYWAALAAAVGLLAACNMAAVPKEAPATQPRLSVALLQGNIPQDEKFEGRTGVPEALDWYGRQLQASTANVVVAPETALPMLPRQLPDGYFEALRARFAQGQQAALIGIPLGSSKEGYTNSVIGLKPGAEIYQYHKHHLVPFGEFVPPLFKWFTQMMNIPLGDFNRGAIGQASFEWQGQRLAPNICYEDLFGEEIAAQFAHPATAPTILVNVSNIGWFGNTVAIDQHLQISRMRAIEFERPMLRATNTGATVIIDHRGQVTHSLPRHIRGVLAGEVEGRSAITPYAWWVSRLGLWPFWLFAIAIVGLAALRGRNGVRSGKHSAPSPD
ncbi:apolipoprotein N-acyltransferase [Caenimonas soli]|uniref:apolipoprotein N-acyltransferase n=1 Tax=Caenimonas soli TaxID=2735555 RepID=UPI00155488AE|nr:apolipoprotein N-acyltransferase [Caenimonas soli]NPC58566.1 apolipoprotein N-acyltransferase [Caenimonas soli]